ncbi:hypothetical protein Tco_0683442 [Tanacetum coccineum]|uniref:Reverse transcriptase domain-containing protein n=1 Tax=Tanacetum coccineum TaxID=301880 RepID=A0ABQ4XVQ7_9ASTR
MLRLTARKPETSRMKCRGMLVETAKKIRGDRPEEQLEPRTDGTYASLARSWYLFHWDLRTEIMHGVQSNQNTLYSGLTKMYQYEESYIGWPILIANIDLWSGIKVVRKGQGEVGYKLGASEELKTVELMDVEVKRLKRSRIPLIKVRWNSKRGPEFTWEREDNLRRKPLLFTRSHRRQCCIVSLEVQGSLTGEVINTLCF